MRKRWLIAGTRLVWLVLVLTVSALLLAAWQELVRGPGLERLTFTVQGQEFELLDPVLLGLLAVIPLLWLAPLYTLSDLPRWQRWGSMLLRSLALIAAVGALSRPALTSFRQQAAAVFLADVSDSIPDEGLLLQQQYLEAALRAAGDAPTHVITFAAEPLELVPPGTDRDPAADPATSRGSPPPSVQLLRHPQGGQATDLEAALKMAYGLFPPDHLKRVVLLTDGNQTDGDLLSEALSASRFGVKVHFHTFEVQPPPEVLVADLLLPQTIEVGSPFSLQVQLHSTTTAAATVTLWQDNYQEGDPRQVELQPGVNAIDLPATVREAGFKQFRVEVAVPPDRDRFSGNNSFTQVAVVKGKPRILLLEGEPQQARYLEAALRAQQIEVEVRGPQGMPSTIQELESFDLLLLSDVPATYLSNFQMELVATYLKELGGGFIMAGGENSLGLGGYFRTPLEEFLPVRLDVEKKRESPSLAIALVIDKSGSMADDKIELAKEAAKAVVELLDLDDRITVVAFDAAAEVMVRLQPARNRLRILELISRLRNGGGTSIMPGLQASYDQLGGSDAQVRHVILLTDGLSPKEGVLELAAEMAAEGITLSTVAVLPEADRGLLGAIAETGQGRAYTAASMREVPRIFTKETQTVAHNALVEEPFHPVEERRFQILKGIPLQQAPYLLGYVSTRAKKGAEVLLTTEKAEPLLARWKYGLGTSLVWTSDIKNRWSVEWIRWQHFPRFWAQLVRDTMRVRRDLGFELHARVEQGRTRIELDALDQNDRFVNGMQTRIQIEGPNGYQRELELEQTAAGRYTSTVNLPHFGSYQLKALHLRDGKQLGTTLGGLANPYPQELLRSGINRELLQQVASLTGGKADVPPDGVLDPQGEKVRYHRELKRDLILLALALFLADLLLRRVRLGRARELTFP